MNFQDEPGQGLNPYPWYHAMREAHPVYFDQERYMWSTFRYPDVQRVLTDYESFSSQMMMSGDHPLSNSIINMDPPRHRQLRTIVSQVFTPRAIARLAPRIAELVHEILDPLVAQGKMDIINDLAYPLPVMVIAEMLGVPTTDRARFKHWSDIIVGSEEGGADSQQEIADYFTDMFEQRKREPQDDLLTALLAAQVDGQHLTSEELLGFCILLLVAGNITTTNLIGNAFVSFHEFPEALQELYADLSLVPSAVEEVLRYRSPVQNMFRITLKETVVGDQQIGPGQPVRAWIGSANRDPEEFPNPDVFDIRRSPNRHISFGHGIHFCLGAPLSRLEGKIVLEIMLERLKNIQIVPGTHLEAVSSMVLHGVKHLPITFESARVIAP